MKNLFIFSLSLFFLSSVTLLAQQERGISEVQFLTKDSIRINAGYQIPKGKISPAPAIILIHQGGSSMEEWYALPLWQRFLDEGYAILAYDIRQHGKSAKDDGDINDLFNNPNRAPFDLLAAIKFLEQDTRIDSLRIGIVGASIGANLACVAAASEKYHVKSAVSISAKVSAVQNLSGQKGPLSFRNVFYIASKEEQNGMRAQWANELYAETSGNKKLEIAEGDKHGSFILRENESLEKSIVEWFRETL